MASDRRCALRISDRGVFVDGDRVSPVEAAAYCKRQPGGAAVEIVSNPTHDWDLSVHGMVLHEDAVTTTEWAETRSALERERVWFFVRNPLADPPPEPSK